MKKFKYKKIIDPIYQALIILCYGPKEEYANFMDKRYGLDNEKKELKCLDGMSSEIELDKSGDHHFVLWVKSPKNITVIAHEAIHICCRVFDCYGVSFKSDNDEGIAYYVEFLMREFLKL